MPFNFLEFKTIYEEILLTRGVIFEKAKEESIVKQVDENIFFLAKLTAEISML